MKYSLNIYAQRTLGAVNLLILSLGIAVAGFSGSAAAATGVKVTSNVPYGGTTLEVVDEYLPATKAAKPTPAVVFIHGGAWGGGDKAEWSSSAQNFTASTGWPAFNMNYNTASSTKYSTEPLDVQIVISLIKSHASQFNIDPMRIGVVGASAGGHLALLAATTGNGAPTATNARVKAVVSWSGPSDLPLIASNAGCSSSLCPTSGPNWVAGSVQAFEGGTFESDAPEQWKATSPAYQVDTTDPTTLLFNSTAEIIPLEQMAAMNNALKAAQVPVKNVVYSGSQHAQQYSSLAWPATLSWLKTNL